MALSSKYKIKESFGNLETHEVFLDTLAHQKEEELGIPQRKFEVEIKSRILYVTFGVFLLLAGGLFAKTGYFQIFEGRRLQLAAENNKGSITLLRPERGIIYDKNLEKLVVNAPAYDLLCQKKHFLVSSEALEKEVALMSGILELPAEDLRAHIIDSSQPNVLLAENVSQEKLLVLEARLPELPGCSVERNTVRSYAIGPAFSHVLGYGAKISKDELAGVENYTIADYIGKTGLEKQYESYLRGTPGRHEVIKTAAGVQKGSKVLAQPVTGESLVLNIDAGLQQATYRALERSIKNIGSKKGAAVALDPRTGAVLALVSYPAYDNNIFSEGISQTDYNKLINDPNQPFFDRVIGAKYPTGSTVKPFLASGALQEKIISPTKIINDPGFLLVQSQNDPDVQYRFGGVTPHGDVDMRKALAVSSNIYFYTIGGGYGDQKGLGPSGIKKYLDMYGWEQKTGIDLPGEWKGFVPSPEWKKEAKKENWWDGDTYNLSIGQSDLQVTPLHVAVAYAAIANGGTLYKPQIVQKIVSSDGKTTVKEFAPQVNGKLDIDAENLQVVREGMRDGVRLEYGSSLMLNNIGVHIAGKTGTVETGKAGTFNTWSSNFAPYENPEIVFVATIEGVQGLRSATLPVAREVLDYYFNGE